VISDKGRPVVLRFNDGTADELPVNTDIAEAIQKLAGPETGKAH